MTPDPTLVLVAHGTTRASARTVVGTVVADVRSLLPAVDVRLAHVDVQSPGLTGVLADVHAAGRGAVVVPLLLSAGFHVEVDIAEAVDPGLDRVTPTLAGDPLLVDIGLDRLHNAGGTGLDAVVVAATGSSRSGAREQVQRYAADLGAAASLPVTVGWVAGAEPSVDDAVETAQAEHGGRGRIGVVSYLLAPGVFAEKVRTRAIGAGALAVGDALGPDPRLAQIVVARFRAVATAP